MNCNVLLDTGPLVALLNHRDHYHEWALTQWGETEPPLLSCEAVLSEACFLLRGAPRAEKAILAMVQRGAIDLTFRLQEHCGPVSRLMEKYASVPMSLADACLVRLSELRPESPLMTVDRDFRVYRRHGRQVIPVFMPE
jgi:uncharacterized protein